LMVALMDT
jgi:hypothetical protein